MNQDEFDELPPSPMPAILLAAARGHHPSFITAALASIRWPNLDDENGAPPCSDA